MTPAGQPPDRTRLLRHDRRIAINTLRATFANWSDRGIAALLLLFALTGLRHAVADRPWHVAAWGALAIGALGGIAAARLVAARLAFHTADGLLAADALHAPTRRRYVLALAGIAFVLLIGLTLAVRPALLAFALPGHAAGWLFGGLAGRLMLPRAFVGTARPGRAIRAALRRPIAGPLAALVLLATTAAAPIASADARAALVGIGTLAIGLSLTIVDDAVVRFRTLAGHRAGRIVVGHAGGLAGFLALMVPISLWWCGPIVAAVVAAIGTGLLLLVALRILAYRLHARRFADLLVSLFVALLVLTAWSLPVALPLVAAALLWHLHRRGRDMPWRLA